ncbi:putative reverse transcriptase domain-containing protein [Tanacetum coccineum]|uniref:Reverse transcriptase domain-containing protein n=1 Tax=Tanacetum coccineum TaxID=301880 RepID=A0ABQ4Z8R7_9ASTR
MQEALFNSNAWEKSHTYHHKSNIFLPSLLLLNPFPVIFDLGRRFNQAESVKNWKTLESPTEIRSFLRFAGYYRRFIENFSKIAKPLTMLARKNKTYGWGDKQGEVFCILKEKLCNAPVLALPDGPNDFVVYCDASKQGFGCVVMQRGKVIAYTSRQLKTHDNIKERLKTTRSHQKTYADKRRKPLEFKVGDRVLIKVSPRKEVVRFGKKGKLAPRYVGPFEIVECVGTVAYRLKLPQELSCVHDTFHVSNLKKCLAESDVQMPLEEIEINENLRFVEEPIEIVKRDVKKLKRRRIPLVKVRWNSRKGAEYT